MKKQVLVLILLFIATESSNSSLAKQQYDSKFLIPNRVLAHKIDLREKKLFRLLDIIYNLNLNSTSPYYNIPPKLSRQISKTYRNLMNLNIKMMYNIPLENLQAYHAAIQRVHNSIPMHEKYLFRTYHEDCMTQANQIIYKANQAIQIIMNQTQRG